jgi:M6 family metalloprotease-like protein
MRRRTVFAVSIVVPLAGAFCSQAVAKQPSGSGVDAVANRGSAAVHRVATHRVAPALVRTARARFGVKVDDTVDVPPVLPSVGQVRIFAVLIDFVDHHYQTDAALVDELLFGDGSGRQPPFDSLRGFYQRSSYGLLDIDGDTLGWYRTSYPRSSISQTTEGREQLIREAISHFDQQGHDFSQYDNDGDGVIEYFMVFWAGPVDEWSAFWFGGYISPFEDQTFVVDGKRFAGYNFTGEQMPPGNFTLRAPIHETGHAMGLPDYYSYEDNRAGPGTGVPGGVGRLDMMATGASYDHNCFSKFLLGWIEPVVINQGTHQLTLAPSDVAPDSALLMPGEPVSDPFAEYFMVQYRRPDGNDDGLPGDGLLIWHVDARLDADGEFLCDNTSTDHKLLRLMEADGLEQIERGRVADAGDFYRPGDVFGPESEPCSDRYDGACTNILVDAIAQVDDAMGLRVSLGSGCAVTCDADVPGTGWPGEALPLHGAAEPANCQGTPSLAWSVDGQTHAQASFEYAFRAGSHPWQLQATLGDAACARHGSVLVCTDGRCNRWRAAVPMHGARAGHAAARLADGRVLVVGGGAPPEVYDPAAGSWSRTGSATGSYLVPATVRLADGRELVTGSTPFEAVNAEIYDADSDSWSVTGQMAHHRLAHSAVVLADGRVLVAGGAFYDLQGNVFDVLETELFDPQTETWSAAGAMADDRVAPGLVRLPDGRVLATGGSAAEVFDPATLTWSAAAGPTFRREYHVTIRLSDGRILVVGGSPQANGEAPRFGEIFDPSTGGWSFTATAMSTNRVGAAAVLLGSGRVLVTGGNDSRGRPLASAEIYDPVTDSWTTVNATGEPRSAHRAIVLDDGSVLVTGGTATPWRGDPDPTAWLATMTVTRYAPPDLEPPRTRRARARIAPAPPH